MTSGFDDSCSSSGGGGAVRHWMLTLAILVTINLSGVATGSVDVGNEPRTWLTRLVDEVDDQRLTGNDVKPGDTGLLSSASLSIECMIV
jgi:hypothetical protein